MQLSTCWQEYNTGLLNVLMRMPTDVIPGKIKTVSHSFFVGGYRQKQRKKPLSPDSMGLVMQNKNARFMD